jgi:hypothetical protein
MKDMGIRDAENAKLGIVSRTVNEAVASGKEPTKAESESLDAVIAPPTDTVYTASESAVIKRTKPADARRLLMLVIAERDRLKAKIARMEQAAGPDREIVKQSSGAA